jgi:hypothetical protein
VYKSAYVVYPKVKALVDDHVEYNTATCEEISMGSWTVDTKPKRGTWKTGTVTGKLSNGDCPDDTFRFAALYYDWTSANPTNPTDDFSATWNSGTGRPPVTHDYSLTLIRPFNLQQVGPGVQEGDGDLHFNYKWDSTSGKVANLSQCEVGELVAYPSRAHPFRWPSPPYSGSTFNPTITWVAATLGEAQDNHSHNDFLAPYVANAFTASQLYRYQCRSLTTEPFPGWTNIPIERTVRDITGKGCWIYTVTKSGFSASVVPLPGVSVDDCTTSGILDVPQQAPEVRDNANELSLSVDLAQPSPGFNAPIFFDLTVLNRSADAIAVDLGLNRKANLELSITDPAGRVLTRRLSSGGFGASGELSLAPGGKFVETLLLNEWYEFPSAGAYRIRVTLLDDNLPGGGTANADRPSTEFSVEIGPRDPQQLEAVARELANTAIEGATLQESMDAANALSYVRDSVAVDSLVRILQQGSLVEHYAVDGLGRIATPEAIAALEAARDHPDEDVRAAVRSTLETLQEKARETLHSKD